MLLGPRQYVLLNSVLYPVNTVRVQFFLTNSLQTLTIVLDLEAHLSLLILTTLDKVKKNNMKNHPVILHLTFILHSQGYVYI
jgi:hypothetical protein